MDRSTPRKLNSTPKHPATQTKAAPINPVKRPSNLENGSPITPRRNITDSATHRMRDRLTKLNINGVQPKAEPKMPPSTKITGTAQYGRSASGAATPKQLTRFSPGKTPSTPSINGSAVGRASSVGSARPRKLSHVNGIVRQFDAANGSIGSSEAGARSDMSGKRQPPKLKRKALG